jgi:hypothetical protein
MREIKFRGKRIDNGEWVYGLLLRNKLGVYIITEGNPHECTQYGYIEISEYARVNPETVGQLTGLEDRNGKEIYEGDIVIGDAGIECAVDWDKENARFHANGIRVKQVGIPAEAFVRREVIGNIYSNPELLGGENNG